MKWLTVNPTALTHNRHLRAGMSCVASSRSVSKQLQGVFSAEKVKLRRWYLIKQIFTARFHSTNQSKQTETVCWHTNSFWRHNQSWDDPTEQCSCVVDVVVTSAQTRAAVCLPEGMKGSWRHSELACQLRQRCSRLSGGAAEVFSITPAGKPLYSLGHWDAPRGWLIVSLKRSSIKVDSHWMKQEKETKKLSSRWLITKSASK